MTDNKGPGRPANGDYPVKLFVRISEDHLDFLKSLEYETISAAVRALFDEAIDAAPPGRPRAE